MFTRTQNGEKVEVSNMVHVHVEPDDVLQDKWKLSVNTYGKNGQFTGTKIIAEFDSVKKANDAYLSLEFAFRQRLGWDAIEYLKEQ